MSYARFGSTEDGPPNFERKGPGGAGSDVYIFLSVSGHLECCGCLLSDDGLACPGFHTTAEMLDHLEEHREIGHTVLDRTIRDLKEEAEENDQWIAEQQAANA